MMTLPPLLAKKEDAITQEDMAGDWSDPKEANGIVARMTKKMSKAFQKEPNMAARIKGNFLDLIDHGFVSIEEHEEGFFEDIAEE